MSPDIVIRQLAEQNQRSAQQIYEAILAPIQGGDARSQRPGGGGAGGGVGWKTLAQYCAGEGIETKDALTRLQAKGIQATANQTLREIAVNNGFSRPFELIDMIRAK